MTIAMEDLEMNHNLIFNYFTFIQYYYKHFIETDF